MTNKKLLKKLAEERLEVIETTRLPNVLNECLSYQLDFINDPAKHKAVLGTRRSAKSYMFALYLINQAVTVPKSKCIYMGLTNESCKQIMWSDIIDVIFDKYHIAAECNSKYEIEFDNGSVIYLRGLDATPHQMNRLRGQKFDIAVIDEAQDFTQDVEQIIDGVLKMALAQTEATICLGGTPGNKMGNHYWWRIWEPESTLKQWKLFHFNWKNNTSIEPKTGKRVCDAIQIQVNKDLELNPLIELTPKFRQEVLGEWVVDTDARVYKSSTANYIDQKSLPNWFHEKCTYILSMDLGYYDATAFVISAYNKFYDNNMYVLESFKKTKLTITAVANIIKELEKKYKFTYQVVDAANAQCVAEMRLIHSLPLIAAEKLGKEAHIALINSDFLTQNIKILRETNIDLKQELDTLIWDSKALLAGTHKENAKNENHLTDALLYGHVFSRHYWWKEFIPPASYEEQIVKQIEDQFLNRNNEVKQIQKSWWSNSDDSD
jgi:PBSX family phage terminase large subunit